MKNLSCLFTRKAFLSSLKLILILAMLAGFFYYVPLSRILGVMKTVDLIPLLWTLAISLVAIYIASVQLWVLARKQGIAISVQKLFVLNLSVRFYSFISPLSTIGSLLRWQRLAVDGKAAEGLVAVAANRVLDVIVAVAVGLFWAITALNQENVNVPLIAAYLAVFLFVLWLLLYLSDSVSLWARRNADASQGRFTAQCFGLLTNLFRSLAMYRSFSSTDLFILTFTAVISQLITLLAYVLIALALHVSISMVDLGWMRALLFLASLAPFTMAGGFGVREVSTVVLMSGMGIAPDQAAAFSLLIYARSLAVSLIGGILELFLFLLERRLHLK
ncbi:MAG: flippase-like domain-containing protein [Chloroflexi bacterium]|nr:flippase-like domain-containing protein [Chloroflexota bacterium]